jgi:subtilisin family serine protease
VGELIGIPYPGEEGNTTGWSTIGFSQGTSYACPLVVGFLALLLEVYPNLTHDQVKTWIHDNAITGVMYDAATPLNQTGHDRISIDGSDIGRVLYWKNHKKTVGYTANNTYGLNGRPASGAVYPRVKKLLKG